MRHDRPTTEPGKGGAVPDDRWHGGYPAGAGGGGVSPAGRAVGTDRAPPEKMPLGTTLRGAVEQLLQPETMEELRGETEVPVLGGPA